MKRGSSARHCHVCRKIIGWSIPTGSIGIIGTAEMKWLPAYGGYDSKGYLCKDCKKKKEVSE